MVTWEAVQKENYLGKLEKQRKGSKDELLRKTAHRCAGTLTPTPAWKGRSPPQAARGLRGPPGPLPPRAGVAHARQSVLSWGG